MSISGESDDVDFWRIGCCWFSANPLLTTPRESDDVVLRRLLSDSDETDDVDFRQIGCCRFSANLLLWILTNRLLCISGEIDVVSLVKLLLRFLVHLMS